MSLASPAKSQMTVLFFDCMNTCQEIGFFINYKFQMIKVGWSTDKKRFQRFDSRKSDGGDMKEKRSLLFSSFGFLSKVVYCCYAIEEDYYEQMAKA